MNVVELRQYTLRPGRRDELIELFEREFVESQEALGIRLPGRFRDLDDPDRFVWVRGFESMEARKAALEAFYYGPVWKKHGPAANATMLDSDNVLLLRPLGADFPATMPPMVTVTISDPVEDFDKDSVCFETLDVENTFPRLPVREGEKVFVRFDFSGAATGSLRLSRVG
ncbi:NIPSNAP family protein [Amycolatopsis sp. cg5]|uniref:NIPSNAP family protein n=1 Tax=Amycolatopsis sp. cg5 TaxID=3238802 RepID=UPI003525A519